MTTDFFDTKILFLLMFLKYVNAPTKFRVDNNWFYSPSVIVICTAYKCTNFQESFLFVDIMYLV